MIYQCKRCGRDFACDMQLSFCPFCGTAYFASASAPAPAPVTQRIVIGSDGERTVQDKYWRESRQMIRCAIRLMGESIPQFSEPRPDPPDTKIPKEFDARELNIDGFFSRCRAASTGSFGTILGKYLGDLRNAFMIKSRILHRIHEALQNSRRDEIRVLIEAGDLHAFEDEYSIQITEEECRICDFCYEAAQALGCDDPLMLRPAMRYAPEDDDWARLDDDEADFPQPSDLEPYERLLSSLLALQDTLIQTVHSNSAFILANMGFDVNEDEDEQFDPAVFIPLLQQLSAEDYDPIFGKAPDEMISTFSEAIARLTAFVNTLPDYLDWNALCPEKEDQVLKRRLDNYKTDCLQHFLSDWQCTLEQELDRAYQGQHIDMMQASSQIARMTEEL